MRVIPILLVVLAGCGKAEPSKSETPKPPAKQPVSKEVVRRLDLEAVREIHAAFTRNPIAAREQYREVRWMFYASPFDFSILDVVHAYAVPERNTRIDGNEASVAKLLMKDTREAAKLQREVTSMCEGYLDDWHHLHGLTMVSVVVTQK